MIETPIEIVEERAPREEDPEIQAGTEIAEDARLVANTLSNSGDTTVQEHPYSYIFMTTKESIDSFGFEATHVSVRKELQHMIDKGVFEVVNLSEHSQIDKRMIVPSKLFIKEKNGVLKSRLVAGGHRQNPDIYERKSSPTISTSGSQNYREIVAKHEKESDDAKREIAKLKTGRLLALDPKELIFKTRC